MQDWQQISSKAKDLLTICLARAIDMAMTARQGENWFADFAEDDLHQKVNNRITKSHQRTVYDLDLQAVLKILRYRTEMANAVLTYHGFYSGLDEFSAQGQTLQLNNLLDRLINDFRNRIAAHNRAADIEKELSGEEFERIYGYEEAYQDMLKLSRIFPNSCDADGVAYCRRMADLATKKKKLLTRIIAGAAALALTVALLFWLVPKIAHPLPEPEFDAGDLCVQIADLFYDDGELVALCYINNGINKTVSNIDVFEFKIYNNGELVASADFGVLEGSVVRFGETIQWAFRFPKEALYKDKINTKEFAANIQTSYDYQ